MKWVFYLLALGSFAALLLEATMYVESADVVCIASILLFLLLSYCMEGERVRVSRLPGKYVGLSYLGFWALSFLDIVFDHYFYYGDPATANGEVRSILFKLEETSDELLMLSILSCVFTYAASEGAIRCMKSLMNKDEKR